MKITGVFCIVIMIVLGVYDGIATLKGSTMSSVSRWVIETGYYSPCFTFLMGCLVGHLFLAMVDPIIYMSKDLDKMKEAVDSLYDEKFSFARQELRELLDAIKKKRNRTGKIC